MHFKRAKRVRIHLIDPSPQVQLPSVEGLLVSKRQREYVVAVAKLITSAEAQPIEPASQYLVIPRERVGFYEVIA